MPTPSSRRTHKLAEYDVPELVAEIRAKIPEGEVCRRNECYAPTLIILGDLLAESETECVWLRKQLGVATKALVTTRSKTDRLLSADTSSVQAIIGCLRNDELGAALDLMLDLFRDIRVLDTAARTALGVMDND